MALAELTLRIALIVHIVYQLVVLLDHLVLVSLALSMRHLFKRAVWELGVLQQASIAVRTTG